MLFDAAILIAIVATGYVMGLPTLRRRDTWRAMITPLASIIGSGFLILGPVLDHAYGVWAPLVMFGLCAVAWSFGAAIRFNIAALGDGGGSGAPRGAETLASALLGFAYIISVAYYLNLFGAFALSLTPFDAPVYSRGLTTFVYLVILYFGWTRGFRSLEVMEYGSVAVKLAIIAGLIVALAGYASTKAIAGVLDFEPARMTAWPALTLAFGLIVTVQGFETSRYLGQTYSARVRVRSMRAAQLLATAIYLTYTVLLSYSFQSGSDEISETAIIHLMGQVSPFLPALLVAGALAAQFSAAVADTSGSGGLFSEITGGRIAPRRSYAITVVLGITLTWTADVFEIITLASRAFAAYYGVQAGIAAWRAGRGRPALAASFAAVAVLGAAIAILGEPVE